MRIALIDPSLFTLPYDAALADGLRVAGHEVTLHGRNPREGEDSQEGIVTPSFYWIAESPMVSRLPRAVRLGIKGVDHFASMALLARRLRRERPDAIHFQWLPLPAADLRFLDGLRAVAPLVLTVHDTEPFNGSASSALQRRGMLECYARFDHLIVHTEAGRRRLVSQGVDEAVIRVLPHGLLAEPTPANDDGGEFSEGAVTFTLFGQIKPYKGADLLIEALAAMPQRLREQARVRVIGRPYMDICPLLEQATARGVSSLVSVEPRFVPDDEIGSVFGRGVVACFPYREIEASGVFALATAHGRPLVASALGCFAETVVDGESGLLVSPGNVTALAQAMSRIVENRAMARSLAAGSRYLAKSVPSWKEIGRRTVDLYLDADRRRALRSAA